MTGGARRGAGRPPKPLELKKALGNPGKRPLPDPVTVLPAVATAAAVPTYETGAQLLQVVLDSGASAWIGPTDVAASRLVDLWDDMQDARRIWRQDPTEPHYKAYVGLSKEVAVCLSALGLDPTARGRLGLAAVKTRSKLEEMRARREAGRPAG